MVSLGRTSVSLPWQRRTAFFPANRPENIAAKYPSSPVSCPAKNRSGRVFMEKSRRSSLGESIKVFRCMTPYRTNSAFFRAGIMENTRLCSGNLRFVWKPTKLYRVFSRFSCRSCTTAQGRWPVLGSLRPTGFSGPNRKVSAPRWAITSTGIQPS